MKKGAFDLKTPADLLGKLRNDVQRLTSDHADSYAAFDVAVTGYHLAEWVASTTGESFSSRVEKEPVLKVARAVANGAKHFLSTQPQNGAVTNTTRESVWAEGVWADGVWDENVWYAWLEIEVAPEIGNATGVRKWKAHEFAAALLSYWEGEIEGKPTA